MSVAYVLDEIFLEHRPPSPHPERPERIAAVRDALTAARVDERCRKIPGRPATLDELTRVHTPAYVEELGRSVPGQSGWLDGDTYFSPRTWDAALYAAGAVAELTRAVLDGEVSRGLALVRPPGHHAEAARAMGFCLLNNIAVGAAAARAHGARRVAIVDWDVHHGNGTQSMFYDDPSVLFLSCHQHPYYPGTGSPDEVGEGEGRGTTVNVGLPGGCGDREYSLVFERVFLPALERFNPDVIMVSAGFDAFLGDTLAGMRVTQQGFAFMAASLCHAAEALCDGRMVVSLEGGYHLDGLAGGVLATLDALERSWPDEPALEDDNPSDDALGAARITAGALAAIQRTEAALRTCGAL